jgi:hypothetical protein
MIFVRSRDTDLRPPPSSLRFFSRVFDGCAAEAALKSELRVLQQRFAVLQHVTCGEAIETVNS